MIRALNSMRVVECRIGDICREDRRTIGPDAKDFSSLPYVSLEHVEAGTGRLLCDGKANGVEEGRSTCFCFDASHVLYGKLRPYLNKVALPDFAGRCTMELVPLLPLPGFSRAFVALMLRRPQIVEAVVKETTGARMPRADIDQLMSLQITVPADVEERQAAVERFNSALGLIEQAKAGCQAQLAALDRLAASISSAFPNGGADEHGISARR